MSPSNDSRFLANHVFPVFRYVTVEFNIRSIVSTSIFEAVGFDELKMFGSNIIMINVERKVRIEAIDLVAIESIFREVWLQNDSLWVFGSRADINRKGGDIDLYIETDIEDIDKAFAMQQDFIANLTEEIGDQKIDVVLNMAMLAKDLPIYEVAKMEGVKII